MKFRGTEIYISGSTFRCLRAIVNAKRESGLTVDAVADSLLTELIEKRYPALVILQKQIKDIEAQMIEAARRNE